MLEAEIRRLMKNLGKSINETLADSAIINERIKEIRDAGYEVFLVVEARIGYSPDNQTKEKGSTEKPVRLRITPDDAKFLKSLKIHVEGTE
jgi:hypothetical protein